MRSPAEPSVDVIIPCYNQGRFLAETIESVLGQTYPHVQVIVIDDGSTDETPEVAARFGDRIRYVRKQNAGVAAARNSGILEAQGEFIHFLDSDDCLLPDVLAKHMAAASAAPTVTAIHGSYRAVNATGQFLREINVQPLPADAFHHLLGICEFPPCCVSVRRAAFARVGLFDVSLRWSDDWDMWLRLAAAGCEFASVPDSFALYRRHTNSLSRNFEGMWRAGLKVLKQNRAYHRNCALCRQAIARGLRHTRATCFPLLIDEIWSYRIQGETRAGLVRALRAAVRTPALIPFLAGETLSYLCHRSATRRELTVGSAHVTGP